MGETVGEAKALVWPARATSQALVLLDTAGILAIVVGSAVCRIRLEAQDTSLSRRRSGVRIPHAVLATQQSRRTRPGGPLTAL